MKILFLCVANSARSQLAEGLARDLTSRILPNAEIRSAGSAPGTLNPYAVAVMKEIGINISHHTSKSVDALPASFIRDLDYIITLCAEESCPLLSSPAKRLHWPLPDPASTEPLSEAQMLERFRGARDAIQQKLKLFFEESLPQ